MHVLLWNNTVRESGESKWLPGVRKWANKSLYKCAIPPTFSGRFLPSQTMQGLMDGTGLGKMLTRKISWKIRNRKEKKKGAADIVWSPVGSLIAREKLSCHSKISYRWWRLSFKGRVGMEEGAKQLKCQQLHLPITGHLDMQVALRWTAAEQSLTWDRTQRK